MVCAGLQVRGGRGQTKGMWDPACRVLHGDGEGGVASSLAWQTFLGLPVVQAPGRE